MTWFRTMPEYAVAVTPSDTKHLDQPSTIYIGTSSSADIAVVTVGGSTVTFSNVIQGSILPVVCKKVLFTGTTATDLVACY